MKLFSYDFEATIDILYIGKDSGGKSPLFLSSKYEYSNNFPVIALNSLSLNKSSGFRL